MEMKPYGRKTRNQHRATAQYNHPPPGPAYYSAAMDYSAAATSASGIYPAQFAAPAYFNPPPAPAYYGFQPPPPADRASVEAMLRKQIEYYFSEDNLIKDVFLRKQMDKDGFVMLQAVCGFQRVMQLTNDIGTVISALNESETIEICDGIKIRPKNDPTKWPIEPQKLQYIPQPQMPLLQQQLPQQTPSIQQHAQQHERNATRLPTQPINQQQLTSTAAATTVAVANSPRDQHESEIIVAPQQQHQQQAPHQHNRHHHQQQLPPSQQTQSQHQQPHQHHQRPNPKQPQPGQTQSSASSPNNNNNTTSSDNSGGTNNIDNISKSSFTYATAVTNKPTAASVVASNAVSASSSAPIASSATLATTPTPLAPTPVVGPSGNSVHISSNLSNHDHYRSSSSGGNTNCNNSMNSNINSIDTNISGNNNVTKNNNSASTTTYGPTAASIVAGTATSSIGSSGSSNSSGPVNASSHQHNNIAPTNGLNYNQQKQQQQQPIGDIPTKQHNKSSTPVESEWKEVKSRRRRPGKA